MVKTAKTAKNPKNKLIGKSETIGFVVNFCAMFMLIFTLGMLMLKDAVGGNAALATLSEPFCDKSCSCETKAEESLAVLFPVTAGEPNEGSIKIIVDDSGYLQKEFILSPEGSKLLEITNKGVNNHSFVIDELGIDTGAIEPGQSRVVSLDSMADAPKAYLFYSNLAGDDREKFAGSFVIE